MSHNHPDHYSDAEIFIEGMTRGTTQRRGTIIAAKSVLSGNEVTEPAISKYHQSLATELIEAHLGDSYQAEDVGIRVAKAVHTDPDGVGYILDFPSVGGIGYTSDTEFFEGIADPYRGVRLLILCVMRPRGAPLRGHLSTDDAEAIIASTKPEIAVLTHFGMRMLNESPRAQAKYIQDSTGVQTVAGFDGMIVSLGNDVEVKSLSRSNRGTRYGSGARRRSTRRRA